MPEFCHLVVARGPGIPGPSDCRVNQNARLLDFGRVCVPAAKTRRSDLLEQPRFVYGSASGHENVGGVSDADFVTTS